MRPTIQRCYARFLEESNDAVALFGPKIEAITALLNLAKECLAPNWDGYGAEPVHPRAVKTAHEVIASLPDDCPLPSCAVEPDGCVSLDWMPSPYQTLTVSVGQSERLPYAWVDGTDRGHAVAKLADGQLPSRILAEVRRISGHGVTLRAA